MFTIYTNFKEWRNILGGRPCTAETHIILINGDKEIHFAIKFNGFVVFYLIIFRHIPLAEFKIYYHIIIMYTLRS